MLARAAGTGTLINDWLSAETMILWAAFLVMTRMTSPSLTRTRENGRTKGNEIDAIAPESLTEIEDVTGTDIEIGNMTTIVTGIEVETEAPTSGSDGNVTGEMHTNVKEIESGVIGHLARSSEESDPIQNGPETVALIWSGKIAVTVYVLLPLLFPLGTHSSSSFLIGLPVCLMCAQPDW